MRLQVTSLANFCNQQKLPSNIVNSSDQFDDPTLRCFVLWFYNRKENRERYQSKSIFGITARFYWNNFNRNWSKLLSCPGGPCIEYLEWPQNGAALVDFTTRPNYLVSRQSHQSLNNKLCRDPRWVMKCSQLVVNNIHQHLICSGSVLSVVSPATRWLSSHQKLRCQHLPMVSISPKLFPSQNLLVYLLSRLFSITGCRWVAPLFSPWHSCTHGQSGRADQLESRCQQSIPCRQHAANLRSPSGQVERK